MSTVTCQVIVQRTILLTSYAYAATAEWPDLTKGDPTEEGTR
jgi:hypothetical protein